MAMDIKKFRFLVRLTALGRENYTGKIAKVSFVDGLSEAVSYAQAASVGAVAPIEVAAVDENGEALEDWAQFSPALLAAQTATEREGPVPAGIAELNQMRLDAEPFYIKTIGGFEYTLEQADYGYLLDFTAGAVVTVPVNLSADFYCTLRQGGDDQIEVLSDGEAVIEEIDDHYKSEKRLAILALARFPNGFYQLSGRTAA